MSDNIFKSSILIKIITVIMSFINTIIINRFLGVSLRGEYTFIINTANMLQLILNLGIGYSYAYFVKEKYKDCKEIFIHISIIQFLIYISFYIIISIFNSNELINRIIALSIILTLNLQILFITMIEDIIKRNKILLISSIIYTTLLISIYFTSNSNLNVVIYITIIKYIIEIIILAIKFKLYKISFNNRSINFILLKKILKVGAPTMIMTLLITVNYNIDVFIMKFITTNYEIGLYGVAVTLANMIWIIPDAFKEVIYSISAQKDCIEEIVTSIIINILICIIITIGFVFLGKWFLELFYGNEYVDSFRLVTTLFIGTVPMIVYKLIHPLYITNGKPIIVIKILAISVAINVVLNIIIIPFKGAYGAALASVISYSICGSIFLFKFKHDYNISYLFYAKKVLLKIKNVMNNCKVKLN